MFLLTSLVHAKDFLLFFIKSKVMAKTREQKEADVKNLTEALNISKLAVLTDYRGLDVLSINELRNRLHDANIGYKVAKNTLIKLAIAQSNKKGLDPSIFTGPMAIAFGSDEVEAAKIIYDFAKDHEVLEIVGAITEDGALISPNEVTVLAKLPSREQLTGQVVGTIAAPLNGLVRVLQANLTSVVYALSAIKQQKG